jgi:hypothetical protein
MDVVSLLAQRIDGLMSQLVQSFGAAPLAALLLIPIFIAASARKFTPALAVTLLSFVSLMLIVAPASAMGVLGLASGLGSFLVALESIIGRRRIWALNKEIDDLSKRLHQLESVENRRLLLEMKARSGSEQKG